MKFKAGQKVKIVKRGQAPPLPGRINTDDMIGMVGTIGRADEEEGYWVEDIGVYHGYDWFNEDALEAVKPEYVWVYDSNIRHYERDENGKAYGSPIYRESWVKRKVEGETTRSWILEYGYKAPKKPDRIQAQVLAYDEVELEDKIWKHDNAYKISEKVRSADAETLRKVAEVIGYVE